ncbi:MAG: hypothetical protein IKJ56_02430 [Bacteroidales bacterium]|nr:hypothetical protein [Bacteroidales bacterium]
MDGINYVCTQFVCPNSKYKYDTLIRIDVSEYTTGTYMVEIRSCYDDVMQTKIVKL